MKDIKKCMKNGFIEWLQSVSDEDFQTIYDELSISYNIDQIYNNGDLNNLFNFINNFYNAFSRINKSSK